jgi:hypothetical protein
MILNRLARRLKEENWVAIAIEFLILVLGVWLGLQAQAWSNARSDQARERQLLADMLGDLKLNRADYATAMRVDLKRMGAANTLLTAAGFEPLSLRWSTSKSDLINYDFDPAALRADDEESGGALWTDLTIGYFGMPTASTYETMTGAGDMRLIRDPALLREIQRYHNSSTGVISQIGKLLEVRQDGMRVGAKYGLAAYQTVPKDQLVARIAANPELAATIRNQGTFTAFHYGDVRNADRIAQELQRHLQHYLDQR